MKHCNWLSWYSVTVILLIGLPFNTVVFFLFPVQFIITFMFFFNLPTSFPAQHTKCWFLSLYISTTLSCTAPYSHPLSCSCFACQPLSEICSHSLCYLIANKHKRLLKTPPFFRKLQLWITADKVKRRERSFSAESNPSHQIKKGKMASF